MMNITNVLRRPPYLGLAAAATVGMALFYSYVHVLGVVENVLFWFTVVPLHNLLPFLAFAVLFGVTLSYSIFLWRQPKVCSIGKGSAPGAAGTVVSFFVAQCPACASFFSLFLPLGAVAVLTVYSVWLNVLSIALMLFTLFRLGAFRK